MAVDKTRLSVYVDAEMVDWLEERSARVHQSQSAPARARVELDLWRAHLAAELRATAWTLPEISCIAHVLSGGMLADYVGGPIANDLRDAFTSAPNSYGAHHGINEEALISKVDGLGPTASHALTDAIAGWWADDARDHTAEGWQRLGLRIAPSSPQSDRHSAAG